VRRGVVCEIWEILEVVKMQVTVENCIDERTRWTRTRLLVLLS
jgi:hypothetical protein